MANISKITITDGKSYYIKDASSIAYATCSSSSSSSVKEIVIENTNWELRTGQIIFVHFDRTNIAENPTFKINGLEEVSIRYNNQLITTKNLEYAGKAGTIIEYFYNGSTWEFIGWSADTNPSLIAGSSATSTINESANNDLYLNLLNGSNVLNSLNIVGTGATTIESDNNGKITINSINTNTDTKVTQTVTTASASYPLLLAPNGQTATTTTTSYFNSGVTLNPSTNTITANISGNSSTSDKVYSTLTEPSSTDSTKVFYIPFFTGSSSENKSIKDNEGLRYQTYQGTTEVDGLSELLLGTSIASGNDGNKIGRLRLYSANTGLCTITQEDTTKNLSHVLPATSGILLNTGTTSVTASLTSGTKIGSIKINGTSTDLYCQTSTDTKVTQTVTTNNADYPLLLAPSGQSTTQTGTAYFNSGITLNPSTKTIAANISGNADTASQVYSTQTEPTETAMYEIPFITGIASGNKSLSDNGSLRYQAKFGTESSEGFSELLLGNSIVSGNDKNTTGKIALYSSSSYAGVITQETIDGTSHIQHILPKTGGTILNSETTTFTPTLTSGRQIGTIKINGTSQNIYAPTNSTTVTGTVTALASDTFYIPFHSGFTTGSKALKANSCLRLIGNENANANYGTAILAVGNPSAYASGNIKIKHGTFRLYKGDTKYIDLTGEMYPDSVASSSRVNTTVTFPCYGGKVHTSNTLVTGTVTITVESSNSASVVTQMVPSSTFNFDITPSTPILVSIRTTSPTLLGCTASASVISKSLYICLSSVDSTGASSVPAGTYYVDYIIIRQ